MAMTVKICIESLACVILFVCEYLANSVMLGAKNQMLFPTAVFLKLAVALGDLYNCTHLKYLPFSGAFLSF